MIKDLVVGESGFTKLICTEKLLRTTEKGKEYFDLKLSDSSGIISAKLWEIGNARSDFTVGDVLDVSYIVTSYKDVKQLKLEYLSKAEEGTYSMENFCKKSPYDIQKMYGEVVQMVNEVKNPFLVELLNRFFSNTGFVKQYTSKAGALKVHHAFIGGLLQHSYFVARAALEIGKLHKDTVDIDLLVTTSLLHDIGKLKELQSFPKVRYTNKGHLIGHVVEGQNMIRDVCNSIPEFPADLCDKICHCILAHHGELEYGSPVKPALIEALILFHCDYMDSRIEIFRETLEDANQMLDEDGWTPKSFFLGTSISKTNL